MSAGDLLLVSCLPRPEIYRLAGGKNKLLYIIDTSDGGRDLQALSPSE